MKTADELAQELKRAWGTNLLSAVLHGSSVNGDTTQKFSDVDVLLVLQDTSVSGLKPALPVLRQWIESGNKAPQLFSINQLERAADAFAIEFADIKDQRRILVGTDPFEAIQIEPRALRHQLEFELRSALLKLRRHYIENSQTPKMLGAILGQSLSSFSALFRTTLRLINEPAPLTKKATWQALNRHVALDIDALEKIWDLRSNGTRLTPQTADEIFQRLVKTVEAVINFVDLKKEGDLL